MKKVILNLVAIVTLTGCYTQDDVTVAAEYGYFEGQKDALTGDIRILCIDTTKQNWVITKSFWEDNKTPIYNPIGTKFPNK